MRVLCGVGAAVTPKVNFVKMVVYSVKVFSHPKAKRANGNKTNKCHHRQLLRHHSSDALFPLLSVTQCCETLPIYLLFTTTFWLFFKS